VQRIALVLGVLAVSAVPAAAKPRPDLVAHALALAAPQAIPGVKLDMSVAVVNRGRATARPTRLGVFLSRDRALDVGDVNLGLRHVLRLRRDHTLHMSITVRLPQSAEWGWYEVLTCADADRVLRERRETNNCAARRLAVIGGQGFGPTSVSGPVGGSISRAIATAVQHHLHLVVIAPGTYAEPLMLADGVNILATGVTIAGKDGVDTGGGRLAAVSVIASHLTQRTLVSGLTVRTPTVTARGGRDAIGILAADDAPGSLLLSHVTVSGGAAGNGARGLNQDGYAGADGAPGAAGGPAQVIAGPCDDTSRAAGGVAATVAWPLTGGGGGGDGGTADTDCAAPDAAATWGQDGFDAVLSDPWNGGGGSGGGPCSFVVGDGVHGLDGYHGEPPSSAATGGALSGSLWLASRGLQGGVGEDGTGGGGGAGSGGCDSTVSTFGAGGGGGGAGGSGGPGGGGGEGGGSAFGLVVVSGAIRVEFSNFAGGTAGAGGAGGRGARGGFGGLPGSGGAGAGGSPAGGSGGPGGAGGPGADGGGGAGGASAGALVAGGGVLDTDAMTTFAAGGAGAGGKGAVDGAPGAAVAILRP
jgi:hypothetical protein